MAILAAVGEKHATGKIIETGYDLASTYGDELQVLHVIPEDDAQAHFDELRTIPDFREVGIEVEVQRAEEVAARLVDMVLDDFDPKVVTPMGRVGQPAAEILTHADAIDARFLVIGGRKRTPAGKALFGSVTQTLILDSQRPVVTRMAST